MNLWITYSDLVDWTWVKKAFLEEAKGKINQNHTDLLSLGGGGLPVRRKHR